MNTVLIAFADDTLGGTSRSALGWGQVYADAGWRVLFRAMRGIHPARLQAFRAIGEVAEEDDLLSGIDAPLLAIHHGAWSPRMLAEITALSVWIHDRWDEPLDVLTNNIFAVPDGVVSRLFPNSRHTTAVLGDWAYGQYRSNTLGSTRMSTAVVVPNPQDDGFFRPPSLQERIAARQSLGIPEENRVVLRLGSPHEGKWSNSYLNLPSRLQASTLVLVGVPKRFKKRLRDQPNVEVLNPIGDDRLIRELYWSADVFAHDAIRGESFGNVILEALLCGVPVVYRARPFRDNTPREFVGLPGFFYVRSARVWTELLGQVAGPRQGANEKLLQYSRSGLASELRLGGRLGRKPRAPSLRDAARIILLHNPIVAALKQSRLDRKKPQSSRRANADK